MYFFVFFLAGLLLFLLTPLFPFTIGSLSLIIILVLLFRKRYWLIPVFVAGILFAVLRHSSPPDYGPYWGKELILDCRVHGLPRKLPSGIYYQDGKIISVEGEKTSDNWFGEGIKRAREGGARVIANLAGFQPEESAALAERAVAAGAEMIELPTYCPHMGEILNAMFPGLNYPEPKLTDVGPMQAAVRLAMRDLRRRIGPGRPILLVGYSNGAALAVDYALSVLDGADLPQADGLVLLSPAIEVSRLATLARIRLGVSSLPGLGRAAWQTIEPEFDPFKYLSFSFHAAGETARLTRRVHAAGWPSGC